ncbi:MAG: intracellular sulfur oxidation DsrE/DsrF family protein [Phenylobacterium sp.]|jgi:intracellular sulfur oxidation DsrE/DsrF family protein
MTKRSITLFALCIPLISINTTEASPFNGGPQIKAYGKHAPVKQDLRIDKSMVFKVAFDISEQGSKDGINRGFNSPARFLNMMVANGMPAANVQLAVVVHGKAGFDLMSDTAYQQKFGRKNPNSALLDALLKQNIQIYLCGQSAAYYKIDNNQLHSGVKMALSAMTAHAVLQNEGYTINPF